MHSSCTLLAMAPTVVAQHFDRYHHDFQAKKAHDQCCGDKFITSTDKRLSKSASIKIVTSGTLARPKHMTFPWGRHKNDARPKVLVTGGAGYIGSHISVELLESGYDVIIVDNLSNSSEVSVKRVAEITDCGDRIKLYTADILDRDALRSVFDVEGPFRHVIHCAGLKSVAESIRLPELYHKVNVKGTQLLMEIMNEFHCTSLVFSSSATVYGDSPSPLKECSPVGHGLSHSYGLTKFTVEQYFQDFIKTEAGSRWRITILRYFNPVGAHPSGKIGEDPSGEPNNLVPYVTQVLVGRRHQLTVFGNDFDTPDGTCVRDFIHVVDVAKGHVAAIKKVERSERDHEAGKAPDALSIYNLGRGEGVSVMQIITAMGDIAGKKVNYIIGARRPGDVAAMWSDASLATRDLGWHATRGLYDMCRDSWNWQAKNPSGYICQSTKTIPLPYCPKLSTTSEAPQKHLPSKISSFLGAEAA